MASVLSAAHFHDEEAAVAYVEARVWAKGINCPHCGNADEKRIGKLAGKSTRIGTRKCYACRKPFTVKVGTIFESSHVPLHLWLQAIHLLCASKKGISSNQLHRVLGITLKSAWFLSHRIREAMRDGKLSPMGGAGMIVEADETYFGRKPGADVRRKSASHKHAILSLIERGGKARSFIIDRATTETVAPIVAANIARETRLMTDEARHYILVGRQMASHEAVAHTKGEYARGDVNTNSAEGFFSIFKRGIYQKCDEKHLHRYLAEFDFRYSNRVALGIDDTARADEALKGVSGKRLTYRTTTH